MYDHIYRMLEAGPGLTADQEVTKLDRVFYATQGRADTTANYRPLIYQSDLRDYLVAMDTRLTSYAESPVLPAASTELDLSGMLGALSDVNLDRVAQLANNPTLAMELATIIESSCEATVRLGSALILLGFAIDRYRS